MKRRGKGSAGESLQSALLPRGQGPRTGPFSPHAPAPLGLHCTALVITVLMATAPRRLTIGRLATYLHAPIARSARATGTAPAAGAPSIFAKCRRSLLSAAVTSGSVGCISCISPPPRPIPFHPWAPVETAVTCDGRPASLAHSDWCVLRAAAAAAAAC